MDNTEYSNMLLRVEQLREHLNDARWCVVDVRHDLFDADAGIRAYREGHIPGAVFADINTQLSGTKTGLNGRHPMPRRDDLIETFRQWGINNDTQIVAYDTQGGQYASRLWWLARWLGHRRVALLDGGWAKWSNETGLVSRDVPIRPRGNFTASDSTMPLVNVQQVLQRLEDSNRTLLDARTPERYRGEEEPIDPVAGHIPGARNRPWQQNLNSDQTFKSPSALRSEFDALLGARSPSQVMHQCGSGVTACHNVFAMELAGLPGSALYGGSWSEWIADPKRPIASG